MIFFHSLGHHRSLVIAEGKQRRSLIHATIMVLLLPAIPPPSSPSSPQEVLWTPVGTVAASVRHLPFVNRKEGVLADEQAAEFSLMGRLNRLAGIEYPDDPNLRARIKSYELAFGMQTSVPDVLAIGNETKEVHSLYGLDSGTTEPFGRLCLTARRLVERGVRFVQIFHGGGGGGAWDSHSDIKAGHTQLAAQVDKPIAALLADLKRRGMLNETIVVWGTEFGRSPGAQGTGRDHHPNAFCAWLAGGGIRGGVVHGKTDELGFYSVEHPQYVTDIHATVLHQLGLDPRDLELPDRRRLDIDRGQPIREILA